MPLWLKLLTTQIRGLGKNRGRRHVSGRQCIEQTTTNGVLLFIDVHQDWLESHYISSDIVGVSFRLTRSFMITHPSSIIHITFFLSFSGRQATSHGQPTMSYRLFHAPHRMDVVDRMRHEVIYILRSRTTYTVRSPARDALLSRQAEIDFGCAFLYLVTAYSRVDGVGTGMCCPMIQK